jgi:hypothetical protein
MSVGHGMVARVSPAVVYVSLPRSGNPIHNLLAVRGYPDSPKCSSFPSCALAKEAETFWEPLPPRAEPRINQRVIDCHCFHRADTRRELYQGRVC